jgi:fructokinase
LDESGSASYEFKLEGTATFDFSREWLPKGKPDVLHIGTLATLIEPGASELFEWASGLDVPVVFDPNIRPSVLGDQARYRSAVERWFEISDVIKMSDEDMKWLGYSRTEELFNFGAKLVVITRGSEGISGYTSAGEVSVPGVKVNVVDTVGAGDTVGAVIVEGIARFGLEELVNEKLFSVLSRATKAAAITCSRAGAIPPSLAELG